jgi:hypothetical protein
MEGYQFFDFFATKNIDYLLAIISLLLLIPFWKMLGRGTKQTPKKRKKLWLYRGDTIIQKGKEGDYRQKGSLLGLELPAYL